MKCKICGKFNCKKHSILLSKVRKIEQFSGSSPPEIFIGKYNYPNVYTGILSPEEYGSTQIMSSPELWHKEKLNIPQILDFRKQLIYGRTQSNIKKLQTKFLSVLKEIAMTHSSVSAEFKLKKPISPNNEKESRVPLISNSALVKSVRLEENPKIKPRVDYLVNDTDAKSETSILELEKSKISTESIIKILSAGLLGLKKNRKLVPTRWSITAVDDALSKNKLKKIRYYPQIDEIQLFNSYYLGNHYEVLLLPENWEFEVIEISLKDYGVWHDYESFFPRKEYAKSVTGAYYANRLAVTEYLEKIKKQASVIVLREIRPEYYAPLGVGILRQTSRASFTQKPKTFSTIKETIQDIQERIKQPIENFFEKSLILKNYGKQQKLNRFLNQ